MKVSLLRLKVIVRWTLFALTLVYIITGLGILYYNLVEAMTFGLLSKALSYKVHIYLLGPFLVLLLLPFL